MNCFRDNCEDVNDEHGGRLQQEIAATEVSEQSNRYQLFRIIDIMYNKNNIKTGM